MAALGSRPHSGRSDRLSLFIQQLLGHAQLTSTQIYTQVSIRKLKEVHSATHPGARLRRVSRTEDRNTEPSEQAEKLVRGEASLAEDCS
jgi:integrase/recombinase XerD